MTENKTTTGMFWEGKPVDDMTREELLQTIVGMGEMMKKYQYKYYPTYVVEPIEIPYEVNYFGPLNFWPFKWTKYCYVYKKLREVKDGQ